MATTVQLNDLPEAVRRGFCDATWRRSGPEPVLTDADGFYGLSNQLGIAVFLFLLALGSLIALVVWGFGTPSGDAIQGRGWAILYCALAWLGAGR